LKADKHTLLTTSWGIPFFQI